MSIEKSIERAKRLRTFERLLQNTPQSDDFALLRFVYFATCERIAKDMLSLPK